MNYPLFILGFLVLYIIGGRKIAIPYAVALTGNAWLSAMLSLSVDIIQIPFFYFVYGTGRKISLRHIKIDAKRKKVKIRKYRLWNAVKKLGTSGIFILSALPSFGGGIWSSVLLAFILKTEKKLAYFLIIAGSFLGSIVIAFLAQGIINFLKILFI